MCIKNAYFMIRANDPKKFRSGSNRYGLLFLLVESVDEAPYPPDLPHVDFEVDTLALAPSHTRALV